MWGFNQIASSSLGQYGGRMHQSYSRFAQTSFGKSFLQGGQQMYGYGHGGGFLGRSATPGMGTLGKVLSGSMVAYTANSIYNSYQEGGIGAAAGTAAQEFVLGGLVTAVGSKVLSAAFGPIGIGAAAGFGAYQFGKAGQKFEKRMRSVEMGVEPIDNFGNMSTLRQRSLSAIQNSHINGRMALGNEAVILHR